MPVATSTLVIGGLVGGAILKTEYDRRKAAGNAPPPLVTLPPPVFEKPDVARAVKLQRAKATGMSGRKGTIKTGPGGITNEPAVMPKTLIGG